MQLRVPDTIAPGTQVKCPKCSVTFAVPAPNAPAPAAAPGQYTAAPPASSPAYPPRFGGSPGPADNFGYGADEPRDPFRRRTEAGGLSTDYKLDVNPIFGRATAQFGTLLGPFLGFGVLMFLILIPVGIIVGLLSLVPILGQLVGIVISAAVSGPLSAGFLIVALAQFRGKPWSFGDFFGGFHYWTPLFVIALTNGLLSFVCLLPSQLVTMAAGGDPASMVYELMTSKNPGAIRPPDQGLMQLAQALQLLGAAVSIAIWVRFLAVANYLVLDRGCTGIEAIKESTAFVSGHYWGWLGMSLLCFLIGLVGLPLCCIGLLFTIPYAFIVFTSTYLLAIGDQPQMQNLPF